MKYKLILEVLDIKDSTKDTVEVSNSQLLREIPAAPPLVLPGGGDNQRDI